MELYKLEIGLLVLVTLNISFKNVKCISITRQLLDLTVPSFGYRDDYLLKRQQIIDAESRQRLGGDIALDTNEQSVNQKLLNLKSAEIDGAHYNGTPFGPLKNFLESKTSYEQSAIFKILQQMPKGGALHVHDCSIASIDWLVKNVTYRDNCYMCYDVNRDISFQFFATPPVNPGCPWKRVSEYRKASGNISAFDMMLAQSMLLTSENINQDANQVWQRFEQVLTRANGLINYKPVFSDYFYEALGEFYADNVQYVEVRALLPQVYELDGTTLTTAEVMALYKTTTDKFVAANPDFTGAKIIRSSLRIKSSDDILSDIKNSVKLMKQFPNHFAGYDIVGQEDPGKPLLDYLDALRYPASQTPPINMSYFFHAGETDWQGTSVDDNLVDAVLLNTSRIGHGYAITKHPEVLKLAKDRNIVIEVNPISNQVLKLVDDMQNHPASVLIATGFPVVISSDDPAVWGSRGLTYDFYAAFMALSGREDGLQLLKQLALNSFKYSALSETEKAAALKIWKSNWDKWIISVAVIPVG